MVIKIDAKTIYAQSSDIKSRTYLEYRKDMKKKAIAELEVLGWLEKKLPEIFDKRLIKVYKSGGDKFLWFLRKGGVTREPDFIAEIEKEKIEFEFQYAEKADLDFYDFKVSKVAKGKQRKAIANKFFFYLHKPSLSYALFAPEWIIQNGEYGMVPAWRSYAFRVPKTKFESRLIKDNSLKEICRIIEAKNFILNFQHQFIDLSKENLSHLLQSVIDHNQIVKIIPKDLESFFQVCFILDNINKVPENANLWLIYLLTYLNQKLCLEDIAKIIFCLDYLYSKIELKNNELNQLIPKIKELLTGIKVFYQEDGSYRSTIKASPLAETRYALFAINLLEDLIQDMIYYYQADLTPVGKIYENIGDILKTYKLIEGG